MFIFVILSVRLILKVSHLLTPSGIFISWPTEISWNSYERFLSLSGNALCLFSLNVGLRSVYINMQYDHEGFSIYLSVYVNVYTQTYIHTVYTYRGTYIYLYVYNGQMEIYPLFVVYLLVNDLLFVFVVFFSRGSGEVGSYALWFARAGHTHTSHSEAQQVRYAGPFVQTLEMEEEEEREVQADLCWWEMEPVQKQHTHTHTH